MKILWRDLCRACYNIGKCGKGKNAHGAWIGPRFGRNWPHCEGLRKAALSRAHFYASGKRAHRRARRADRRGHFCGQRSRGQGVGHGLSRVWPRGHRSEGGRAGPSPCARFQARRWNACKCWAAKPSIFPSRTPAIWPPPWQYWREIDAYCHHGRRARCAFAPSARRAQERFRPPAHHRGFARAWRVRR